MNYIKLRRFFQAALLLVIIALMWGCGNGGGSASNEVVSKNALSISPSSSGEYAIRGDNMEDAAGIELTISYDIATLSSPTVTQSGFISGAMMATNTITPGKIKIAIISTKAISGNGQIATVSFATVTGTGNVSITSVTMIDTKGAPIP
ncbi:MAG: cohesin domain-containing protein [Desulfuromonadaceae bacterium]